MLIKYPMLLKPCVMEHIWGGSNLIRNYNKNSSGTSLSESWEVSVNKKYPSVIANGVFEGRALYEVLEENPSLLGSDTDYSLLIKFINSDKLLSVQVHPDDSYALSNEGLPGKTEAWYILEAEEGAYIYLGFKENISGDKLTEIINDGSICDYLNKIPVKAGQSYIVEAGTVHAIGGGITLIEIQENSDLTYRVYDYNRPDTDGKLRELHIDKALEVIKPDKLVSARFKQFESHLHGRNVKVVAMCDYFSAYYIHGNFTFSFSEPVAVSIIEGCDGFLIWGDEKENIVKGDSVFIPAGVDCRFEGNLGYIITLEGVK